MILLGDGAGVSASRPDPGQRRHARLVRRRRRVAIACLVALVGAGAAALASSGTGERGSAGSPAGGRSTAGRPAARTKLVAKTVSSLPAAISGEAVTATAGGGRVLIVGGLDASSQSVDGVFSLDPQSGRVRPAGQLGQPLHDAAAATLGGSTLVIGGGDAVSTDAVERLGGGAATVVAHLPAARSDA